MNDRIETDQFRGVGPSVGQQFLMLGDHLLVATGKGVVIIHGARAHGLLRRPDNRWPPPRG